MTGMAIVRALLPGAPSIGATVRIACGVRTTNGRPHYCVVASPDDRYRKCRVLAYRVEITSNGLELQVRVRMNQRHLLIQREHWAHANCLEQWRRLNAR